MPHIRRIEIPALKEVLPYFKWMCLAILDFELVSALCFRTSNAGDRGHAFRFPLVVKSNRGSLPDHDPNSALRTRRAIYCDAHAAHYSDWRHAGMLPLPFAEDHDREIH